MDEIPLPETTGFVLDGGPPYFDDEAMSIMDELEIERQKHLPREVDLGFDDL